MKKDLFIKYLNDEIKSKKDILAKNSISDEDRKVIEDGIANLETILSQVEEAEENDEAIVTLKETVEMLQKGLTAVQEKLAQKKEEVTMEITENYLKSQNSVHDFAEAIRNSKNAKEFQKNWNDKLIANGFTITSGSEQAFVPDTIKGMISDIWDRNADWLRDLNNTGSKKFYCRYNTSDQTAENSRAKGHKEGTTKVGQTINMAAKLLEAQYIYKLQELSYQTIWNSDEALITYVINELVDQILYEIKRAILVGDGRASNSDYKINSFEAIAKSSTDAYTTVSTVTANGFLVDDIRTMVDNIQNDNNKEILVFMSKETLRTLSRVQASETSTPVYIAKEQVAEQIGATRIITTDLLGNDYKALAFLPSEYYLVGSNILNPVMYSWHEGYKNVDVWRYECVAGGGINAMKSSAVLKANA